MTILLQLYFLCVWQSILFYLATMSTLLSNPSLSQVGLGVDFVLPLSQEQEEEQEPPTKNLRCY